MMETSPILWFYARHEAGPFRAEINAEFLALRFRRSSTSARRFQRGEDGCYRQSDSRTSLPQSTEPVDAAARAVDTARDGTQTTGDIGAQLGLATDPGSLTRLRSLLTAPAFRYSMST
jgi:hypothetical protein